MGLFINEARYKRSQTQSAISNVFDLITMADNDFINNVVAETALLQSDIFTAIRIISGDIASASYKSKNKIIEDLLNKKANDSTTSYIFIFTIIANTLLNGQGFALIERDKNKIVTGFRNLKNSDIKVLEGENENEPELAYEVKINNKTKICDADEIIHIKPFTINGKTGISPIYALRPELSMQKNGVSLLANSFKRGISTSGVLEINETDLNNESKKTIRAAFEEANAGSTNAGSVMVLGAGEKYTQIEVSTKVLELIQNNKYSTQQIAKTFGIPLSRFGQELVNSSDTDANDIYITSTLNTFKTVLKQEFANKANFDIEISFDVLTGNSQEIMLANLIKEKQGEGVLTVNEVREFYGKSSIENGDSIFKNSASQTLENLQGGK